MWPPAKAVLAAGHQKLPIWAEGNGEDGRFMPLLINFTIINIIGSAKLAPSLLSSSSSSSLESLSSFYVEHPMHLLHHQIMMTRYQLGDQPAPWRENPCLDITGSCQIILAPAQFAWIIRAYYWDCVMSNFEVIPPQLMTHLAHSLGNTLSGSPTHLLLQKKWDWEPD